jgi:putative spermidine/putrescine transport system ATP-binding protein
MLPTGPFHVKLAAFMGRSLVTLIGVSKAYGRTMAVNNVSLEVGEGEFVTLLGPSGSGKTTTLMLIAGFEQLTGGEILVRGESVVARPPEKRDIGMVFQSYALFPHMTVFENVAFPLKTRRVGGPEVAKRVEEVLAAVQMSGLGARYPRQLSGGQQQRVALARALVYRPSLLLMDEPLGALDKKLREEMQSEIKTLQRELGITTIYVTHDQQEALALSDRIAIMNGGDVIQVGSPLALYEQPATDFVAGFLGDVNLVEGVVAEAANGIVRIQVVDGPDLLAVGGPAGAPGKRVRLTIRPERLEIESTGRAGPNIWRGRVRDVVFHGELVRYGVEVPSSVVFRVTRPFRGPDTLFAVGQEIWLTSRPADWRLFA